MTLSTLHPGSSIVWSCSAVRRPCKLLRIPSFCITTDADPAAKLCVQVNTPHLNYQHRGDVLFAWPWYFYAASVHRVTLQRRMDASERHLFDVEHPDYDKWLQHILSRQPWSVPLLIGPHIPSNASDPASRAAILLLLFRPWIGPPSSVLRRDHAE